MISLPIPLIVALMLGVLLASNYRQLCETSSGTLFCLVIGSHALSMVFVGFRWSLDAVSLLPFAATLGVISTVLLYLAFRSLGVAPSALLRRDWPHLLIVLGVAFIAFAHHQFTDIVLVAVKFVYAWLLIRLARGAPGSLQLTRLDWLRNSERALWAAAIMILLSAIVDILISLDFMFYDGQHSASMVGSINLLMVLILAWAAVQAGRGSVESVGPDVTEIQVQVKAASEDNRQVQQGDDDIDQALLIRLNELLVDERFYADTELNLQKLARKAGVPARRISRTVNALTDQNVSQWVNRARVAEACRLLEQESVSVTQAMSDSGFTTKSNFNREFKRVTGMSPSQWRDQPKPIPSIPS